MVLGLDLFRTWINRSEDKHEFLSFFPKATGVLGALRRSSHDHSEPVLRFACLSLANADPVAELFFRPCFVSFNVVGANARRRAHQLSNQGRRNSRLLYR